MAGQAPASLPHIGLILDEVLGATDYPGPLPNIGGLLSGVTALSVPAEQGTYAVTGQDAGTRVEYRLSAEQGSYAVSGQDASLAPSGSVGPGPLPHLALLGGLGGARVIAEGGTYAITGQGADVRCGHSLNAEAGYIAIYGQVGLLSKSANSSGESAPLPHLASLFLPTTTDRTLTADPGNYSYVGSDSLADFEITAATDTYEITGQDAGTLLGLVLAAEQGSYEIAGQDADSQTGGSALVLTADFGEYAITGQDATLRSSYRASVEFGFYAQLGQNANLSVGVSGVTSLSAESGTYSITGYDVDNNIFAPIRRVGVPGRPDRYLVIINGKKHFGSREEIERLIESLAEENAEKPKKKRAKITVRPAERTVTEPEVKQAAEQVQTDIRQMYEDLYRKAVAELEAQEEEDLIGLL
jgi:hypothetical protein